MQSFLVAFLEDPIFLINQSNLKSLQKALLASKGVGRKFFREEGDNGKKAEISKKKTEK